MGSRHRHRRLRTRKHATPRRRRVTRRARLGKQIRVSLEARRRVDRRRTRQVRRRHNRARRRQRPRLLQLKTTVVVRHRLAQMQRRNVVIVVDRAGHVLTRSERDLSAHLGATVTAPGARGIPRGTTFGERVCHAREDRVEHAGVTRVTEVAAVVRVRRGRAQVPLAGRRRTTVVIRHGLDELEARLARVRDRAHTRLAVLQRHRRTARRCAVVD